MRGALRQYLFFGYKRLMANAPYFGIPFGIGKHHLFSSPIA